jgi:hypothetical protein
MWYVNGEPVRNEDIAQEVARMRPHYEETFEEKPPHEREEELLAWARETAIERVLLFQAAGRDPERVPPERVDQRFRELVKPYGGRRGFFEYTGLAPEAEEKIKERIAVEMKVERLCERIQAAVPAPSEEQARAFFEEHRAEFAIPELVHAAHIIKQVPEHERGVEARDALAAVRARIAAGEDFEALVRECSDCPEDGGDLGYFARGQMVPPFERVVFELPVGGVSDVFRTQFGFHIATVRDRRAACEAEFEDARAKVLEVLLGELREGAMESFLDAEKGKARIEER